MTNFIFDTNVVSTFRRPDRVSSKVLAILGNLPKERCFVSIITLMEIEQGIRQAEFRDPLQGLVLRQWFILYRSALGSGLTLPVTETIALRCAALGVPNPRPVNDALIAATALVHDLTLVTRNVSDFRGIRGLRLVDPWAP
ncbi:type II toxin-antitoxin system VapC family toxin [Aureimonas psammosilenae]|uniref:type II toxin-antitoxin system VapC family toxin n=1 Tax=Aureimonas psammosilenae TaxID=2495496 RepID=UPI001260AC65|nr:type II toxin-antitoxin system VapC family toxin [Aureimonas psammosilenae]